MVKPQKVLELQRQSKGLSETIKGVRITGQLNDLGHFEIGKVLLQPGDVFIDDRLWSRGQLTGKS